MTLHERQSRALQKAHCLLPAALPGEITPPPPVNYHLYTKKWHGVAWKTSQVSSVVPTSPFLFFQLVFPFCWGGSDSSCPVGGFRRARLSSGALWGIIRHFGGWVIPSHDDSWWISVKQAPAPTDGAFTGHRKNQCSALERLLNYDQCSGWWDQEFLWSSHWIQENQDWFIN